MTLLWMPTAACCLTLRLARPGRDRATSTRCATLRERGWRGYRHMRARRMCGDARRGLRLRVERTSIHDLCLPRLSCERTLCSGKVVRPVTDDRDVREVFIVGLSTDTDRA